MEYITWIFYLDRDDLLHPLPNARFRRFLYKGESVFSRLGDEEVRTAVVFLRLERGLPVEIIRIEYNRYPLNAQGELSGEFWTSLLRDTMEYLTAHHETSRREEPPNVVGYSRLLQLGYRRRYHWKPDEHTTIQLLALVESRAELPPGSLGLPAE